MRTVDASIIINVPPALVLNAFLEQQHLNSWWGVERSLVEPKPGGLYLLAWKGGGDGFTNVNTGIIKSYEPGLYLHIEKCSCLNTARQIMGPMELLLECTPQNNSTYLHLRQSGYQHGSDWNWLYESVVENWPKALQLLKMYLEKSDSF
jgi:hypothetical protein